MARYGVLPPILALEEGRPNVNFPGGGAAFFTVPAYTPVTAPFPAEFPAPPEPGVARNSVNGPNYRDLNATLTRAFGFPGNRVLGENTQLEFRLDSFNVCNTADLNSSSIVNDITSANVGQQAAF